MDRNQMLRKYAVLAKSGDSNGFENFYILTSEDTYRKISALKVDEKDYEPIFSDVYVNLWKNVRDLETDPEKIPVWISHEIMRSAVRRCGADAVRDSDSEGFGELTEDQQANLWFQIENRIGVINEEMESISAGSYLLMIGRILLAVFVLILTAAVIWMLLRIL